MIKTLLFLLKTLIAFAPFLLLAVLNGGLNLKKEQRSRQFPMPLLALIVSVLIVVLLDKVSGLCVNLINLLPKLLTRISVFLTGILDGRLEPVAGIIQNIATMFGNLLKRINPVYLVMLAVNTVGMAAYLVVKGILLPVMLGLNRNGFEPFEIVAGLFYEYDEVSDTWYVKEHFGQARRFARFSYYGVLVISMLATLASTVLYRHDLLAGPFYPIFAIIVIGEIYFFLNGLTLEEGRMTVSGEDEESRTNINYVPLRKKLKALFGDKLSADNTDYNEESATVVPNESFLNEMECSGDNDTENYALFMRAYLEAGNPVDQNYLNSGLDLLKGRSILFNNPFYYDLIPYAFYAMQYALLRHKKVLVVLGRHGVEENVTRWCKEGLFSISHIPELWNVACLSDTEEEQEPDVGIVTRSAVNDIAVHIRHQRFLEQVGFVFLIEPSRLLTTAQIGLNSLVRACKKNGNEAVFCSSDKNCDGLVDALSHVLLTSISEVSATRRTGGVDSYMCWTPDTEYWQHRMLPNLSRYLGIGTELSVFALKNQVRQTLWYGGDRFPVVDMHWITKQYYRDLLHYADIPANEDMIDRCIKISADLWNQPQQENGYFTVEDESCNVFEIKRNFATRATNQSFINIISQQYLLLDYMTGNDSIFDADPKAIPYIVADYARTERNVILRLFLRMSAHEVGEQEIADELSLIGLDTDHVRKTLWDRFLQQVSPRYRTGDAENTILVEADGRKFVFDSSVIQSRRKYSAASGKIEDVYLITDLHFSRILLYDLQNARYVAEDENGKKCYLGTEIMGQITQKYLPGQFFTIGGKYYEMVNIVRDGRVILRRAADHIHGRPEYRQERRYYLSNVSDSQKMGECKKIGNIRLTRQNADIRVETPAYWQMDDYHDFAGAAYTEVNGIPQRHYVNKQILKIEFTDMGDKFDSQVRITITALMNEVFKTLFAENDAFIAAVVKGEPVTPLTYGMEGENGFTPEENAIYIIEDSQLDIGLLIAVERNLNRIFHILCDYLEWHTEEYYKSVNRPPEMPAPDYTVPESEQGQGDVPKTFIGRIWKKIKDTVKKIGSKIAGIFKKKKKNPDEAQEPVAEQTPEENAPSIEQDGAESAPDPGQEKTAQADSEGNAQEPTQSETAQPEQAPTVNADIRLNVRLSDEAPANSEDAPEEADDAVQSVGEEEPTYVRAPYHERYYLLYGFEEVPESIDIADTLDFLIGLGFGNGALRQARKGKSEAELIERQYVPGQSGRHYCDFCGVELTGIEFDTLSDGRERCPNCSKSAVRTEAEFVRLYERAIKNLELYYGIKITVPVDIQMVNSKKLHKRLGKSFVPTGNADGRVLGVAIRDKKNNYSILIENGSPRLSSIMTMVHELTHIWQYTNWDAAQIKKKYGAAQELEVYEGMAKWSEIQYAYLIGEQATAKREEIITRMRNDEYGRGFVKYLSKYPLSYDSHLDGDTPFTDATTPL